MRKFVPLFFVFLLLFSKTVFAQCDSVYFRNTGTLIFDLLLLDTNKIVAVGDNGYVIKSVNGDKSWRNVSTFQQHYLRAVYAANDSVLYAVGEYKTILKSEDQGETWFPLYVKTTSTYSNITAWLNDVFFFTKDKGFIVGDDALLYSTKDGGRSWKDTSFSTTGSSRLNCISFVNDTLGFIAGGGATLFRTKNGGANWEKINISGVGYGSNITKVKFLDALTGFAVGDYGMCLKTIDGGSTWTQITTPTSGTYMDIDFIDGQTGFIVGIYGNGVVLKTTNGGNSWSSQWN
ncbi:MAG TPA: YCF48-related protein, partial [Flavisolibacter sp.]|nr:YCF48-related protein [Flavisolibacter sp.]